MSDTRNAARTRRGVRLAMLFAASQIALWTGCNAILGNGYGAFDESAVGPGGPGGEGGSGDDALGAEGGGPGGEGGPGTDGNAGNDGNVIDGSTGDGSGCPRMICPQQLVSTVGVQRIAVGAFVYWTTATAIDRVNLDGTGQLQPVAVQGGTIVPALTRRIALQGGIPYVTAGARGAAKCAADLSICTNSGFLGASVNTTSGIAVDSARVYIGSNDDGSGGGGLYQTDLSGGSAVPYTNTLTDKMFDVRVANGVAYYQTSTDIKFVSVLSGTPANAVPSSMDLPVTFAVSAKDLVVATAGHVLRYCSTSPVANCSTATLQARAADITAVILDGTNVIWAEGGAAGAIYRAPLTVGGPVELLADNQANPVDLAVDSTAIYWANTGNAVAGSAGIMKLAK